MYFFKIFKKNDISIIINIIMENLQYFIILLYVITLTSFSYFVKIFQHNNEYNILYNN